MLFPDVAKLFSQPPAHLQARWPPCTPRGQLSIRYGDKERSGPMAWAECTGHPHHAADFRGVSDTGVTGRNESRPIPQCSQTLAASSHQRPRPPEAAPRYIVPPEICTVPLPPRFSAELYGASTATDRCLDSRHAWVPYFALSDPIFRVLPATPDSGTLDMVSLLSIRTGRQRMSQPWDCQMAVSCLCEAC